MKIEIELTEYHYEILQQIGLYLDKDVREIAAGYVTVKVEEFDTAMTEYIEQSFPDNFIY